MRLLLTSFIPLTPLIAGCIAMGAESPAMPGMVRLNWESLATTWGPMALVIAWFMKREGKRDERLFGLLSECTRVMAKVDSRLEQSCAGDEKQRLAIHQLRDDTKDLASEIRELSVHVHQVNSTTIRENTRIIRKDE